MAIPDDLPPIALDDQFDKFRRLLRKNGRSDLCEPRDKEERICHCATCMEAYEAGVKLALQLLEHQCPSYLAAIATTMDIVAKVAIARVHDANPNLTQEVFISAVTCHASVVDDMQRFGGNANSVEDIFRRVQAHMKRD